MATEKAHGGKKNRKYGRNKVKCAHYRDRHIRERNKYKRVLQSCGKEFASRWVRARNLNMTDVTGKKYHQPVQ